MFNQTKSYNIQLFIWLSLLAILYCTSLRLLYRHFNNESKSAKAEILRSYHDVILDLTSQEVNKLLQKTAYLKDGFNIKTSISAGNIEVCDQYQCSKYDLIKLAALLNRHIPQFILYKIKLNNKILCYFGDRSLAYELEKFTQVGDDIQFNIGVSIDDAYWDIQDQKNKHPFWIISVFIISHFLFMIALCRLFAKNTTSFYATYYYELYRLELEKLCTKYKDDAYKRENDLISKISELDFNKQKDLEINSLFAKEANKIALLSTISSEQTKVDTDYQVKNLEDNIPCSIILYKDQTAEKIDTHKLIEIFTNRFSNENCNIKFTMASQTKTVNFVSQPALYQIIYSVTSYLFFLLKPQSGTNQSTINILIDSINGRLHLEFKFAGCGIVNEDKLFATSNAFFKHHVNPFLLCVNQIFYILRINGFDCEIHYNQQNVINIVEQAKQDGYQSIKIENNVISLSSFMSKKD